MSDKKQGNVYVVEQVDLSSDSDTEELLEEVHDLQEFEDQNDNDIENLDSLMNSTLRKSYISKKYLQPQNVTFEPKHVRRLAVVEDYIRNFLSKNGMQKSLNSFQKQWYDYVQKAKGQAENLPDAYIEGEVLKDQITQLKKQHESAIVLSEKAKSTYDKLLKQRDFHKMHHERVQKDKKKLNQNIQRLNALQRQYNVKYEQLIEKYNFTMKDKMLIKIQRDKLKIETNQNKKQPQSLPQVDNKTKESSSKIKFTPFPQDQQNPYLSRNPQAFNYKQTVLNKTQKAHNMPISAVVFHPKKPIVGTGSDDMQWKIWTVNQSQLIMAGQGHKDWISAMKFHPKGQHIVTSSGDSTVKIWDFIHNTCTFTFKDHRQPVWSIDLNKTGDYVITGSLDNSCRLLDINVGKCRNVFRGHVDSVNSVHFKPFSNVLASGSADKTISLWDVRIGLCVQTFYGHENSVNGLKFHPKGDKISSCDSNGIVKTWDVVAGKCSADFSCEKKAAYGISVDRAGNIIGVGSEDGLIFLFNDLTGQKQHVLRGHEQKSKVNALEFDMNSKMIVSGGSDGTYRIWQ